MIDSSESSAGSSSIDSFPRSGTVQLVLGVVSMLELVDMGSGGS